MDESRLPPLHANDAEPPQKAPTIRDVARAAGVAVSTVSYVINQTGQVSAETRLRVAEAIRLLRYEPNLMARNLKAGRARSIGLIAPDLRNPYFAAIAAGVHDAAQAQDILVVLCVTHAMPQREAFFTQVVRARRLDGLIFMSGTGMPTPALLELIRQKSVVLVDEKLPGLDAPSIVSKNREGARLVAEHVLSQGHRRLAIIGGPAELWSSGERLKGYRAAAAAAGLDPDAIPVVAGDYGRGSGFEAARALLSGPAATRPTALICANDLMALGAMLYCRENGLGVPEDVSICGFDDIDAARYAYPGLTSVDQQAETLGRYACDLLLRLIDPRLGGAGGATCAECDVKLVIRGSVAPPR
ncbi:LacI family DNA-binding transcriptional regulator [Acidisoma sp. C75]